MIQAIHKGVEIELEGHQLPHGLWRCDYTLITHPERTRSFYRGEAEFPTKDLADKRAFQDAREAIDRGMKGLPKKKDTEPAKGSGH